MKHNKFGLGGASVSCCQASQLYTGSATKPRNLLTKLAWPELVHVVNPVNFKIALNRPTLVIT